MATQYLFTSIDTSLHSAQMMHTSLQQLYKYIHEQGRHFAEAKLQPWAQG